MLKYCFIGLLILAACSGQETVQSKDTPLTSELSLDSITEMPNDTTNCSCYFIRSNSFQFISSEVYLKTRNYLFIGGYDGVAYVSINNTLTKITLDSTTRTKETCGDCGYIDYYSSGQYKVIVNIHYRDENIEWPCPYHGTITVINAEGANVTQRFYGQCRTPASFYQTTGFKMYTKIRERIPDDWVNVKQKAWSKKNNMYSGIDMHIDKKSQIHLNYFFESHRVTDFKNYEDSIVLVTDNFHGDSIFHWTFRPISKNKSSWSVYKIQTKKYENLGLFKVKKED